MNAKITILGLEPGIAMHSLRGYGEDVPENIKKEGIKDLKGWYELRRNEAAEWQAEMGAYRNADGYFIIPREVLWSCFIESCSGYKLKVGGKNSAANKFYASMVSIREPEIVLLDVSTGKPLKKFGSLWTTFVRIPPRTGSRVLHTRGIVYPWKAEFIMDADDLCTRDQLNTVENILDQSSGRFFGIMSARPQLKKFNYGRFEVSSFDIE